MHIAENLLQAANRCTSRVTTTTCGDFSAYAAMQVMQLYAG
jgi:hypothetical protein